MKVILQKDVPNLGDAGEIKEVSSGYARNYLLPRNLVIPATARSRAALAHHKRLMESKAKKREAQMQELAGSMKDIQDIEIPVRVGANKKMYGSVTSAQIAQILSDKGFPIDKRKVEMGDKIRAIGTYSIKVKLAEKISVPLEINVVPDEASEAEIAEEEAQEAARLEREKAHADAVAKAESGETDEDEAAEGEADEGEVAEGESEGEATEE